MRDPTTEYPLRLRQIPHAKCVRRGRRDECSVGTENGQNVGWLLREGDMDRASTALPRLFAPGNFVREMGGFNSGHLAGTVLGQLGA